MRRPLLFLVTLVAALTLTVTSATAGDAPARDESAKTDDTTKTKVQLAVKAAQTWLGLVDAGNYKASHDAAASLFRRAVTKAAWVRAAAGVREPLGKCTSRKVLDSTYSTSLPGVPDGEYVVIQFEAGYEHKATAIETVTPMLDGDGTWRVSGYYIK